MINNSYQMAYFQFVWLHIVFLVIIAEGVHLFSFRIQSLSPPAPMVLPVSLVGESVVAKNSVCNLISVCLFGFYTTFFIIPTLFISPFLFYSAVACLNQLIFGMY